ncbi:DUF2635 domain-containing protein [Komagataeibacter medellinensis]|uniref:Bacteriophage protein n=1 Tax=Komagataeibacter medellinensis (strain NBRC 3288 / BCRC 11682 / LMG 1693 / Kondo 51) TaxID=634177 RepID=G2I0U0_KOMMN|nr:DUF2635 domain-containing protein [Komagataeibacter medellinensis]BAK83965.1 hypothetical protein GLX_15530 [Komagataeibacter medellinensis NBRC 3288]BAK84548.1 bacteriophage protein [Komagataeibacter medellinensis NBRC 3288]
MKIYPVEGRTVKDPRTRAPVPEKGLTVSDYDPFWARRLRDGDVTKTPPAVDAPAPVAQATAKQDEAAAPAAAKAQAPAQEDKS